MARYVLTDEQKDAMWVLLARAYSVGGPWVAHSVTNGPAKRCTIHKFSPTGDRCTNTGTYVRAGKFCCERCYTGTDALQGKLADYNDALAAARAHGTAAVLASTDADTYAVALAGCKVRRDTRSQVTTPRPF